MCLHVYIMGLKLGVGVGAGSEESCSSPPVCCVLAACYSLLAREEVSGSSDKMRDCLRRCFTGWTAC